jgi:hypothetical protein
VSTAGLVQAYEAEARQILGLPATIVYLPDNPDVTSGLRAFMTGAIGYIEGAPSYTVTPRIAHHELGHLWHFNNRAKQDAFWTARFGACVTAPKTWDEAYRDAHPVSGTEIWTVLPGETIAECFAVAVEGSGHERTLDYGCAVDPAAMRTFFGGIPPTLRPVQKDPVIEWVGPAAVGNYMTGRSGNPVALIVDHWTTGSLASALSRFQQVGQQVSAHFIVGAFGRIVQVVKEEDTAYHAGVWGVNLISIGIEHECGPTMPPTDVLYHSSALLHNYLAEKYHLTLEVGVTVKRHNNIVPTQCPGTLDVERIVREAEDMAFTQADRDTMNRIKDILEAREALVWQARAQRFLDIERGTAYNPNLPPIDPRIKAP